MCCTLLLKATAAYYSRHQDVLKQQLVRRVPPDWTGRSARRLGGGDGQPGAHLPVAVVHPGDELLEEEPGGVLREPPAALHELEQFAPRCVLHHNGYVRGRQKNLHTRAAPSALQSPALPSHHPLHCMRARWTCRQPYIWNAAQPSLRSGRRLRDQYYWHGGTTAVGHSSSKVPGRSLARLQAGMAFSCQSPTSRNLIMCACSSGRWLRSSLSTFTLICSHSSRPHDSALHNAVGQGGLGVQDAVVARSQRCSSWQATICMRSITFAPR